MKLKSIKEAKHLLGQRILVRVDFNVPVKNGKVADNWKIQASLPTIKFLLHNGARVILVSHLGRPTKKEKRFSLLPVAKELEKLIGIKVFFGSLENRDDWEGEKLVLLENIRFYKGEDTNDLKFVKQLSQLADVFVLDGFAVAHRDCASVSGVTKYLPAYAGLLLVSEVEGLSKTISSPKQPMVVMLGGLKIETKLLVLKNLLPKAGKILLAGEIFNTYLWAKGHDVGISVVDKKLKSIVLSCLKNKKIILPIDVVVGTEKGKNARMVALDKKLVLKKDEGIFDIGPKTVLLFSKHLKTAKTLIWNGAMGKFEQPPYHHSTYALARLFASRSKGKAFGVCGGGETLEILRHLDLLNDIDLVSTGGGAMLEFLSGKKLPGLKNLLK
ncbi:MAG: phosphoglycerate kinase [Candidatus Magasanikbacteria bacterium]